MSFNPSVGESLRIDANLYRVAPHPAVSDMPYGQSGRKATVYALDADGSPRRALKVFTPAFRSAQVVAQSAQLRPLADLPGMGVCERVALSATRHAALLKRFPDLEHAVLMPWAAGETWQELVLDQRPFTMAQCRALAVALAETLAALEARGVAHCDLSGANLIIHQDTLRVSLVDVEDLYAPGIARPRHLPAGSPGYAHRSAARGLWEPRADRFAGAILLSEILAWHLPAVRDQAAGETFFTPDEIHGAGLRAQLMTDTLHRHAALDVAKLFARAWASRNLDECPALNEWAAALGAPRPAPVAPMVGETLPAPAPAPPAGLSLSEADAQVASYAEAYRVAPGIVAISYGRALQRRGLLREHAGDAHGALADYQAGLAVAPAGELADELRVAADRVAPLAAVSRSAPPVLAATVCRPTDLPTPPLSRQPVQVLSAISASLPAGAGGTSQPRDDSPWPTGLPTSSRGAVLRALLVAALVVAAALPVAGAIFSGALSAVQHTLQAYSSAGLELCAAAGLGSLVGALYAYAFRDRLGSGQGLLLVILALGGAALGGVIAGEWLSYQWQPPLLSGLLAGGIEGGAAGLALGLGLSAILRGGPWVAHGLLGWAAIWAVALAVGQALIPTVGFILGPAIGWAIALVGCTLSLTAVLHHATEVEV